MVLTFVVYGVARPKGSFRAYTYRRAAAKGGGIGARATNDNKHTTSWQHLVAFEARQAMGSVQLELAGAVHVQAEFYLPRPKSLSKRYVGPHLKKPDVDKILRAIFDALKTAGVYTDDSQVTTIVAGKCYAGVGEQPRTVITVRPLVTAPAVETPLLTAAAERTLP